MSAHDTRPAKSANPLTTVIVIGVAVGVSLGVALDNFAVGIAIGAGVGLALGSGAVARARKSADSGHGDKRPQQ